MQDGNEDVSSLLLRCEPYLPSQLICLKAIIASRMVCIPVSAPGALCYLDPHYEV